MKRMEKTTANKMSTRVSKWMKFGNGFVILNKQKSKRL